MRLYHVYPCYFSNIITHNKIEILLKKIRKAPPSPTKHQQAPPSTTKHQQAPPSTKSTNKHHHVRFSSISSTWFQDHR